MPYNFLLVIFASIDSIIDVTEFLQKPVFGRAIVLCFELACLVKPPFHLHTLSHIANGNDFSPLISVNESLIRFQDVEIST